MAFVRCETCWIDCVSDQELEEHRALMHEEANWFKAEVPNCQLRCAVCPVFEADSASSLVRHLLHAHRIITCALCDFRLDAAHSVDQVQELMKQHLEQAAHEKTHKCGSAGGCPAAFYTSKALDKHRARVHQEPTVAARALETEKEKVLSEVEEPAAAPTATATAEEVEVEEEARKKPRVEEEAVDAAAAATA